MIQQINLYLPEFRKKKDPLGLANMTAITVALVVVLLAVTGFDMFRSWQLGSDIARLEGELDQARARTNALIDSFGSQIEDAGLAEDVAELDETLQGKRALLEFLDSTDIGNANGLSEFLADLSRFHVSGLRLTGIELNNGGSSVVLRGEVSQAENVPLYLQNLRRGESYYGKTFETLRIDGSADDSNLESPLTFIVSTAGGQ